MKDFFHTYGYSFDLKDDNWKEVTVFEKIQMNLNSAALNYVYNEKYNVEFGVFFDHVSKDINEDLDEFTNLCEKNMIQNNYIILNREKFEGISSYNLPIHANKIYFQTDKGAKKVAYYMRLSGQNPDGYVYGCLMGYVTQEYDIAESCLIEAMTNWKYVDVKIKSKNLPYIGNVCCEDEDGYLWNGISINLPNNNTADTIFNCKEPNLISNEQIDKCIFAITNIDKLYNLMMSQIKSEYDEETARTVNITHLFIDYYDGVFGFLGEWIEDVEHGLGVKFTRNESGVEIEVDTQDILL